MVTYLIQIENKNVAIKQKAINKLVFHDYDTGRLLQFEGGRLAFDHNPETGRLEPKVEDLYVIKHENRSNEDDIRDWIRNVGGRYGADFNALESDNKTVAVDIENQNQDIFEYALDRKGLRYDIK